MSSKHKQSNTSLIFALILLAMTVVAVIFYQQNKNATDAIPAVSESDKTEPAEVKESKEEQNLAADTGTERTIVETSENDVQKDVVVEVSPKPPFVETIRVEPDGAVVLAGRSDPDAQIIMLLDDAFINSVQADASGNFVALFDIGMSTQIRVISLLAIVDGKEVYAEEDIIIAASTSEQTILSDETVVVQVETDVGEGKTASQGPETPSQEELPKNKSIDTETEDFASVVEKTSDMQAEKKTDLVEGETNTAALAKNESAESTALETMSKGEATKQAVVQTDDATTSNTTVKATETETQGPMISGVNEKETTEQNKIVALIEEEGDGKTSTQRDETETETKDDGSPVEEHIESVVEKENWSETPVYETVTAKTETEGTMISELNETGKTELKEVIASTKEESDKKTSTRQDVTTTETKDDESPVEANTESVVEKENLSKTPVNETVAAPTEADGTVIAELNETGKTELKEIVASTNEESDKKTSKQQDETATETKDDESPVEEDTESVVEKEIVASIKEESDKESSPQQDETATETKYNESPVEKDTESVVEKENFSETPLGETVTAQMEKEPGNNATEKQEDNEVPFVKETVQEAAEVEKVEEEPLVVIAGKKGVKVLQSSKESTSQDVSVDAISYDETGDVALTGRGNPSQKVRIYLDNMPVSTAAMDATGQWRTGLSEIDAGVYTLRVDELDQTGNVVSRLETPFKREKREDLAAYMMQIDKPARINVVTVQPGNTLWAIARERYGQGILYVRVFEENKGKIRDPDLIYPGQVFSLPDN